MMHKFGVHVSIAGGIEKAPERAAKLGCDIFQVFVSNPRSWKEPAFSSESAELFRHEIRESKLQPVTVHATYLPNPANPEHDIYTRSVKHLLLQYQAAKDIGADFFVLHPGSHKKSGLQNGIAQISNALKYITGKVTDGPVWLFENTAGGGDTIGKNAGELIELIRSCDMPENKIGICLDSCHAFASGIDITDSKILKDYCRQLETGLFTRVIKLIHLNDSKFSCSENRDRHEHIGLGKIGENGMKTFLKFPSLKNLPVILETPDDEQRDDRGNLQKARELSQQYRLITEERIL